jgi:hypothetical protein
MLIAYSSKDHWISFFNDFASSISQIIGHEVEITLAGDTSHSGLALDTELEVLRTKVDDLGAEVGQPFV